MQQTHILCQSHEENPVKIERIERNELRNRV
jgi:hypothetical protein